MERVVDEILDLLKQRDFYRYIPRNMLALTYVSFVKK